MNTIILNILIGIFFIFSSPLFAETERPAGGIDILFYNGKYTETTFLSILLKRKTDYRESLLAVGGINYRLSPRIQSLRFETEGQLGFHYGTMGHTEANGLLISRYQLKRLPISFALGEGLSMATKTPSMENRPKDIPKFRFRDGQISNPLLNYILVEMDFALPRMEYNPRAFIRIHHRSGVFGTYCPPTCGSNFISYGIKLATDS